MIIAVIGKGGAGKTTVTGLLLRRLLKAGQTPVLAIDADPSNCLGPCLGIEVSKTLADSREALRSTNGKPPSMSSAEWLALSAEDAIQGSNGFDLLTMGRPEGKGCYCFVNNLIRDHLARLSRGYRHVLVDCEAGLEHLSRRTSGRPDVLVCVANRSRMAAETVRRSLELYTQLHAALPPRVDLVLNQFEAGEPLAAEMAAIAGGAGSPPEPGRLKPGPLGRLKPAPPFSRTFVLPWDPAVAEAEATGTPLMSLSDMSPAVAGLGAWEAA